MQTLSTGKILGIVIGLIAVIGAGYVVMQGSGAVSTETDTVTGSEKAMVPAVDAGSKDAAKATTNTVVQGGESNRAAKGSFKYFLGMTASQKCSVSQSSDISKSTGTFYFSGGKGRGTFESTVLSGPGAGVTTKNSMIMEGETIHVWDGTSKQGMTLSVAGTSGAGGAASSNPIAEQFNQAYDYDCQPWTADASMFVRPADVTFMNMAEMMKGMGVPSSQ